MGVRSALLEPAWDDVARGFTPVAVMTNLGRKSEGVGLTKIN